MVRVFINVEGKPDTVLKFTDKQWAAIQASMKQEGKRSFRAWLISHTKEGAK